MRKVGKDNLQNVMEYTWNNYTVLVAEDDPLNYRYVELLLSRRTGINIIWAKDGKEAVNLCKNNDAIDIVLLDLQLPVMDGLNSLQRIKERNPFLPVIIQTANSWNNEEEKCTQAGCDAFFNKPLDMEQILSTMSICLNRYSSHKLDKINS
ncbi:MAG: response regulator [Anaerolineales bacterium]